MSCVRINTLLVYHLIAAAPIIYGVYSLIKKLFFKQKVQTEVVLFFPQNDSSFLHFHSCHLCSFPISPSLSYANAVLCSSRRELLVCLYILTNRQLAAILLDAKDRGVSVKMITSKGEDQPYESQVKQLRKNGIPVRRNKSGYLMHHKFIIVDGQTLLNGSYNWTMSATFHNNENMIITEHREHVQAFLQEFNRLWCLFSPKHHKK